MLIENRRQVPDIIPPPSSFSWSFNEIIAESSIVPASTEEKEEKEEKP